MPRGRQGFLLERRIALAAAWVAVASMGCVRVVPKDVYPVAFEIPEDFGAKSPVRVGVVINRNLADYELDHLAGSWMWGYRIHVNRDLSDAILDVCDAVFESVSTSSSVRGFDQPVDLILIPESVQLYYRAPANWTFHDAEAISGLSVTVLDAERRVFEALFVRGAGAGQFGLEGENTEAVVSHAITAMINQLGHDLREVADAWLADDRRAAGTP